MKVITALLDIKATGVGGVLLLSAATGSRVLAVNHQAVPPATVVEPERLASRPAMAIKTVLRELIRLAGQAPAKIIVFFDPSFYAAQTQVLKQNAARPLAVTSKLISDLITDHERQVQTTAHELLESRVLNLAANGYPLAKPNGQMASELSLTHFVSLAPTKILTQFKQAISSVVPSQKPDFHSFIFALFHALNEWQPTRGNYLVVEVGGEVTELTLVWRDSIKGIASFPGGSNSFLRHLDSSTLRLFLDGRLNSSASAATDRILAELREDWLVKFGRTLSSVVEGAILPEFVYLVAEAESQNLAAQWLRNFPLQSLLIPRNRFRVLPFEPALFCPQSVHCPAVTDPRLLAEISFCDRILS